MITRIEPINKDRLRKGSSNNGINKRRNFKVRSIRSKERVTISKKNIWSRAREL